MVTYLDVGDPHVKVTELEECGRLADEVLALARAKKVDKILVTGDCFHSFALLRQEVIRYWKDTFKKWTQPKAIEGTLGIVCPPEFEVIITPGNHDMTGDGTTADKLNALMMFEGTPGVTIVSRPMVIDKMLMLPYYPDPREFVKVCNQYKDCLTVYCHQEFNGSEYENGLFSKNGVNPEDIPQSQVISGHIHKAQNFGKIFYVGSPRWLTASDANQNKALWVITHGPNGTVASATAHSTEGYCRKIVEVDDTPESPFNEASLNPNHEYVINVRGPSAWLESRKPLWTGRARPRMVNTDVQVARVKESEGISVAFQKFAAAYQPKFGTELAILKAMAEERLFGHVA